VRFKQELNLNTHVEWSINEKVAYEVALAASYTGKRAAVIMKQVGLNVAADPLMSSAYTGVKGGFVVISCDDPGPHSSQTEQDTRFFALFAKVPALDPSSPREARELVKAAFELSEKYRIPVILRPAIRICHARQNIDFQPVPELERQAAFEKDPARWAATPRFRYTLHKELNEKLKAIEADFEQSELNVLHPPSPPCTPPLQAGGAGGGWGGWQ
jgi:indolepyruvate ferredoxin oxidoreductase alpha subunit